MNRPLISFLLTGSLVIRPQLDRSHRQLLDQIRKLGGNEDVIPWREGWILRNPSKYQSHPLIAAALADYRDQIQLPLATPSSTACSGSSSSCQG
jgi:hypothetical protein